MMETALLERSFYHFAQRAWQEVETVDYVDNWHIRMIADALQAVHENKLEPNRLLINIPPGCMKSRLTTVFWPLWRWIHDPSLRFVCSSFSKEFAVQHSVETRDLLRSAWYQSRWGHRVRLAPDQNQKGFYATRATGWRLTTVVPGPITGKHPDCIIIDDPHNATEPETESRRREVIQWWDQAVSARGISRNASRVLIMQRLHQEDLSGHILSKDQEWVHICLPMEYEDDRMGEIPVTDRKTGKNWTDPRTEDGDLLWPGLLPAHTINALKADMNSQATIAGQLQQRPVPRGGGMFKEHWFKILTEDQMPDVAEYDEVCRYWDKASGDDQGDYTAGVLVGRSGVRYYVLDVYRKQVSCGKRDDVIDLTASLDSEQYGSRLMTRFEQEPGSGGKQSAEISLQRLAAYRVTKEPAIGKKTERADPLASECERGNVFMSKAPWNRDFLNEIGVFPHGKHDDQVDAVAGAYRYLALHIRGPLSAARLTGACTLDSKPNPKDHPYATGAQAIYLDHVRDTIAHCAIGLMVADGRFGLLECESRPMAELDWFLKSVRDVGAAYRIPGVAFIGGQATGLAKNLVSKKTRVYPTDLDQKTRKRMGQQLAETFREGMIDLYRDDTLLQQLVRLPLVKKTGSYVLEDPEDPSLEIEKSMAFSLALYWAQGMLQQLPRTPPA